MVLQGAPGGSHRRDISLDCLQRPRSGKKIKKKVERTWMKIFFRKFELKYFIINGLQHHAKPHGEQGQKILPIGD
jgi:hypothetical protein